MSCPSFSSKINCLSHPGSLHTGRCQNVCSASGLKTQAAENARHQVAYVLDDDPRRQSHPQQAGVHVAFGSIVDVFAFFGFGVIQGFVRASVIFTRLNFSSSNKSRTPVNMPATLLIGMNLFLSAARHLPCCHYSSNHVLLSIILHSVFLQL